MRKLGYSFLALLAMTTVIQGVGVNTDLVEAAMRGDATAVRSLLDDGADVNATYGDGSTALHWAAGNGNLELTRLLLDAGARVDATTRIGRMTSLFMAAKSGEAAVIEALLGAGASANESNGNGTTVLMSAAASGNRDAVRTLIDSGADVNATEETNGQTALMFAATLNRREAIRVLLENGADADVTTKVSRLPARGRGGRSSGPGVVGGMTALHFAARDGQMESVRELVTGGADVNVASPANQTPPITEAIINANLDIAKFLLDSGADVTATNADGLTPLYATVDIRWRTNTWYPQPNVSEKKTMYLDLMEEILAHGADVNARQGKRLWFRNFRYSGDWVEPPGATALWRAAQANDVDAIRVLAGHGANPTIATTRGVTPLMVAAGIGFEYQATNIAPDSRMATVRYLVEELGADVNSKDVQDYSVLHGAAYVGDNDVVMYLVARGADVRARASGSMFGTRPAVNVRKGTGDTIADMANGPREKSLLHPDTVELLERLGSENSHDCRSTACIGLTKEDSPPGN
jgi:ankyrin repeat protein